MKYTVYSDMHLYGPNPVSPEIVYNKNTIFLGDDYEMKNIPHAIVDLVFKKLKLHNELCIQVGAVNTTGNHEMRYGIDLNIPQEIYVKEHNLLIFHGDKAMSPEYALWRNEIGGKSKKAIALIKVKNKVTNFLKKFKKSKLSDKKCEKIFDFIIKYNRRHNLSIDKVFLGHLHPRKLIVKKYKGMTFHVFPRGKTEIEL